MEFKKHKAHTRYKDSTGKLVPGVTTALDVLAKKALIPWANREGLKGIDISKSVDTMAEMGTLIHHYIECFLTKQKADDSEYSKKVIDIARVAFWRIKEWIDKQEFELIGSELPFVSDINGYGGTIDILWRLNGVLTLTDIKTSKGIYPDQITHFPAIIPCMLIIGYDPKVVSILRVEKSEDPGFEYREVAQLDLHFEKFLHALAIYRLNKEIGK